VNRDAAFDAIEARRDPFDLVVIGGGATGAGIALDAASRGLAVLLLERGDFGEGTSSRSTKIIHGGVRYLAQGRIGLVREALHERAYLLDNASHLVNPLPFVVPVENFYQRAKYFSGLKFYDFLAGADRIGSCHWLDQQDLDTEVDGVATGRFSGGMRYFDAQFDDARLLLNILETADAHGALVVNYAEVVGFEKGPNGRLRGVGFRDQETGRTHEVAATAIVNATGAGSDALLRLDDPGHHDTIMPSQGSHIVVGPAFLPGKDALLMPRTPDGRVMFAIPWLEHVLIGTTDTAVHGSIDHPLPHTEEIDMILEVAGRYLRRKPARNDILSTFAGIRPLLQVPSASNTANVSREHRIDFLKSGLVSISGGKWTTYRLMAEQCVDAVVRANHWQIPRSATRSLKLSSCPAAPSERYPAYGRHAAGLLEIERENPELATALANDLPYTRSQCVWAIRAEMARTLEDVLARRTRALFLDARAAISAAPVVLDILKSEFRLDPGAAARQLDAFEAAAREFISGDNRSR